MFEPDHAVPLRRSIYVTLRNDLRRMQGKTVGNATMLALIINQFLFWTERAPDRHLYLEEERQRVLRPSPAGDSEDDLPRYGWIYRKIEQLIEDIMLDISETSMRDYLKQLVRMGYLYCRRNTRNPWDQTREYRLNLAYLYRRLHENGFTMLGYTFSQLAQELLMGLQAPAPEHDPSSRVSRQHAEDDAPFAPPSAAVAPASATVALRDAALADGAAAAAPRAAVPAPLVQEDPEDKPQENQDNNSHTLVVVRLYQSITGRDDLGVRTVERLIARYGLAAVLSKMALLEQALRAQRTAIQAPAAWLVAALQHDFEAPIAPPKNSRESCPHCGDKLVLQVLEREDGEMEYVWCQPCMLRFARSG